MCGANVCVALRNDGTAAVWGHRSNGNASGVDLTNVAHTMCGMKACVAMKNDGTAVSWGLQTHGGDSSSADLTNVLTCRSGNNFMT